MASAHEAMSSEETELYLEKAEDGDADALNLRVSSEDDFVPESTSTAADLVENDFMIETHCGGEMESVPEFSAHRALTEGFESQVVEIEAETTAIPFAWEDEFEKPEDVCGGTDDRTRIRATSSVPWRSICQLFITRRDGIRTRGTGWFIGPRTVMTAGHCVYSRKARGWASRIEVIPGMDESLRPFGTITGTSFRTVRGWAEKGDVAVDYGAIILPTNSLGNRTGWFGYAALGDPSLRKLLIHNAGYAGDRDKPVGSLWYNAGRITRNSPRRLYYMVDTYGGHSGSPIFYKKNGRRIAIGIHNYGGCPNKATRITRNVFDNLKTWKNLGA